MCITVFRFSKSQSVKTFAALKMCSSKKKWAYGTYYSAWWRSGSRIQNKQKTLLRTPSYLKVIGSLKLSFPDLRGIELTGNHRVPKTFLGSKGWSGMKVGRSSEKTEEVRFKSKI